MFGLIWLSSVGPFEFLFMAGLVAVVILKSNLLARKPK